MSLKLKRKKRTTVPPLAGGTYLGICIGIIDLGEQYNQNFKNYADKLMLLFEKINEMGTTILAVEGIHSKPERKGCTVQAPCRMAVTGFYRGRIGHRRGWF